MFTDLVGFTATAQANEPGALKLLAEQEGLLRPLFEAHQGRAVKSTGDGFLVEFDSALHAVQCAIEIQQRLRDRNSKSVPPALRVRIGIHLGDVEQREGDIFGDSVNIASRIEPLAPAGGICITGSVYGQVRNKLPHMFRELGPRVLKNVSFPIDVYEWVSTPMVPAAPPPSSEHARLAVLPFANISPDPNDAYLAEGLTEELITVLSRLKQLRVIARTSVVQYKSTSKPVSQIASELGVSVVLEGSVRKSGDQLRVAVTLVDVSTQHHLWTNTYDRRLENIFAVQSDIARRVAKQLKLKVRAADAARIETRPTVRGDSYVEYLKGRARLQETVSRESLEGAKGHFEQAIALDAKNAAAYSGLADAIRGLAWYYEDTTGTDWEERTREITGRAIRLDPNLAEAHASMGLLHWDDLNYPAAEREFKRSLAINPSYSPGHFWYAVILEDLGRGEEALEELRLAEATDPFSSKNLFQLSCLLLWLGRLEEAFEKIQKLGELAPSGRGYHNVLARYYLAKSEPARALPEIRKVEEEAADPRLKNAMRALYHTAAGEREKAVEILRAEDNRPLFSPTAWILGWIYAELGDLENCFRWLEKARVGRNLPLQQFRLDPRLEHVRKDPRFRELLSKLNLA